MDLPLLLCLDYGKAKVGLAVGSMTPATPLEVIRYNSHIELLSRLKTIIDQQRPEALLWGWPADDLQTHTPATDHIQKLANQLSDSTGLPSLFHPETLTTKQAMSMMIAAGLSQKRRRLMEDSYAAAAILNHYLESYE